MSNETTNSFNSCKRLESKSEFKNNRRKMFRPASMCFRLFYVTLLRTHHAFFAFGTTRTRLSSNRFHERNIKLRFSRKKINPTHIFFVHGHCFHVWDCLLLFLGKRALKNRSSNLLLPTISSDLGSGRLPFFRLYSNMGNLSSDPVAPKNKYIKKSINIAKKKRNYRFQSKL